MSGFICDDVDEIVAAVGRIGEIDPAACRQQTRDFGADQMGARYESVYTDVVSRRPADVEPVNGKRVPDVLLQDAMTSMLSR